MASLSTGAIAGIVVAVIIVIIIVYIMLSKKKTVVACTVDTDCTTPQVCISSACADAPAPAPAPAPAAAAATSATKAATADNGQACTVGTDCTSGFCVSSVCSATAAPTTLADGKSCTADNDCTGGHCYYDQCVTSTGVCSPTTPCASPSTHDCVNGACLVRPAAYGCTPGCAGGYLCDAGKCQQVNWASVCDTVTCPTGQVCDSTGKCVADAAVYKCAQDSDCKQPVGPDAVCNADGYCSCNYGITQHQNTACIGGTIYSTGCSGTAAYAGLYNALDGYTCTGYNYRCAGVVCPYGQSCTNGVCK
jgi:hypothetical protein